MKNTDDETLAREKYESSEAKETYRRPPKRHANRDASNGRFHPTVGLADIHALYGKKAKP